MIGFALRVAAAVIASLGLGPMTMTHAVDDSVSLPPPRLASSVSIKKALTSRRSVRAFAAAGVSLDEAAQLLWAARGITHSEGLRTAPSAGALSPLEIYLLAGAMASLLAGIYRYEPETAFVGSDRLGRPAARAGLGSAPPSLDCRCSCRCRHRCGVSANAPEV
jgi:hypothetical protein